MRYKCFKLIHLFFIHAIYPDAFEFDGSRQIRYLNEVLSTK